MISCPHLEVGGGGDKPHTLFLGALGPRSVVAIGGFRVGKFFGTDGIRAKANQYPMTSDFALKLGQVIGYCLKEKYPIPHPRVVIGKDTRLSGYMLEKALAAGLLSMGVDVWFLGVIPTPAVAYLTKGLRAQAGVVISASHNPFGDNGIKIFDANGYKISGEVEAKIEAFLEGQGPTPHLPEGANLGRSKQVGDASGQYCAFLREQFGQGRDLEGVTLVVDCANGAAYRVAPAVFEQLGARVFTLGINPNGTNINDGCGALYPNRLQNKVKDHNADMGIALDGDADRLIVVDEKGEVVDGDQIMAIAAGYMHSVGQLSHGTLVATVMSNMGLEIAMRKCGVKVIRTNVGDKYISEKLRECGYNFGGEQSGHLIFGDCATTGDGILAALNLLNVCLAKNQTIGDLKKCLTPLPQVLLNVAVDNKIPLAELAELEGAIAACEGELAAKGRVLFRYSGTENLARIMIEGEDPQDIAKKAQDLADITKRLTSGG